MLKTLWKVWKTSKNRLWNFFFFIFFIHSRCILQEFNGP